MTYPSTTWGCSRGLYTNYAVESVLEEILESQNENLGKDVASMDGQALLRRVPITFVKELDLDSTNPLYLVDWGELHVMGLSGWWMKETVVEKQSSQHTVSATHTDCTYNLICRNRRKQGVLATNTTMGY